MEKVKVSKEEFDALKQYTREDDLNTWIKYYIEYSNEFTNNFKPLKNMGLEKFVKCLVNGYELEMPKPPNYRNGDIEISFNYQRNALYRGDYKKSDLFFFRISTGKYIVFNRDEALNMGTTLLDLVRYHDEYLS